MLNDAGKKFVDWLYVTIYCKVFGRFVAALCRRAVTLGEGPRRAGWLSPAVSAGQGALVVVLRSGSLVAMIHFLVPIDKKVKELFKIERVCS